MSKKADQLPPRVQPGTGNSTPALPLPPHDFADITVRIAIRISREGKAA